MKKVYYLSLLIIMCLLSGCFDYNELRVLHSRNKEFLFEYNDRIDDERCAIRFCTSWATREETVERLVEVVKSFAGN